MPQVKSQRNQSIECARLIASFFVVFIHCPFPGKFGEIVTCVARFAVPMFFMISGYFSYGAGTEKLAARIRHILWLNLWASLVGIASNFLTDAYNGGAPLAFLLEIIPTAQELIAWILLSVNPFGGHLWYLTAICVCYVILWGYVCFAGQGPVRYQPLYVFCACLYAMEFLLGEMTAALGVEVPYMLYRNALLFGLPMFGLGIFLREYRDDLMKRFGLSDGKLMAAILLGVGFSLLSGIGIGGTELPIGMVAAVAALLLLTTKHPKILKKRCMESIVSRFGDISVMIYIIHRLVINIYELFFRQRLDSILGQRLDYFMPVLVLGTTLMIATAWEWGAHLFKRRFSRGKTDTK